MTRNPVQDSEQFSSVYWSSILNGIAQEAIVSGCVPSKGTGDFDIDITSGEALVQGNPVNVGAQTATLSTAASNDRVDLVHVDATGTLNSTEGTPAADPIAPDIPSGEVLVAAVLVEGGGASLNSAGSKIADYRTIRDKRLQSVSTETRLVNEQGNEMVVGNDGSHHRFLAQSSTPAVIRDAVGGFDAMSYAPGASAPNTFDWGGNDFTNLNSVSTDDASVDNTLTINEGTSSLITDTEPVQSVSTTAVNIYSPPDPNGGFLLVSGRRNDDANETSFFDIVVAMPQLTFSVVQKTGRPSAAARTYSVPGSDLQLAMGSDTYDVFVSHIEMQF